MIDERLAVDLDRMKAATADALAFTAGMSQADFFADRKTQAATAMCLPVIGEAASRIAVRSPDFMTAHPEMSWHQMRGLRNRVVHDYDAIDFDSIWQTVTMSLPDLLVALEALGPLDPRFPPHAP